MFDKRKKTFQTNILKIEEGTRTGNEFLRVPYGYLPTLPDNHPSTSETEEQEEETEEDEDRDSNRRASHLRYYLGLHAEQA